MSFSSKYAEMRLKRLLEKETDLYSKKNTQPTKFEKYSAIINPQMYAWFVWQKGFSGNPTIKWIHNEQKQ